MKQGQTYFFMAIGLALLLAATSCRGRYIPPAPDLDEVSAQTPPEPSIDLCKLLLNQCHTQASWNFCVIYTDIEEIDPTTRCFNERRLIRAQTGETALTYWSFCKKCP